MRQETQGDVMMPADPAPYLVVVEADLAFALLDTSFHRPACRRALGQCLRGEGGGGVGEEGFELPVRAEAAAQDDPHVGAGESVAHGHRAHAGDLGHQWPLGPLVQEVAPPRRRRQGGSQHAPRDRGGCRRVHAHPCAGTALSRSRRHADRRALPPDARRVRDVGNRPQALRSEAVEQGRVPAEALVAVRPAGGQAPPRAAPRPCPPPVPCACGTSRRTRPHSAVVGPRRPG